MILSSINFFITTLASWLWGWPLVIFIVAAGVAMTIATRGIQFRSFIQSWRYVFSLEKKQSVSGYITPLQAFVNTLSASIGNGSAAGMATAMYSGGPGAAFWIFIVGFLNMAIRFAEVFVSTSFVDQTAGGLLRGGPMVFLQHVPGKRFLPSLYAAVSLFVTLVAGSAMQCNSMSLGIQRVSSLGSFDVALILLLFITYCMLGGAKRIIAISDTIVPIKVSLFFMATIIVLMFHYHLLYSALILIVKSAFEPQAITGALAGHTIQNAIRFGISRSLSATEAGLGTAGILFGATKSNDPIRSGIMSMASIFVSNHLVCCTLMLMFVATGTWNSGLTSIAMTSAAFETVFGIFGRALVTFLSIVFGVGVLVAYAYIGRECWLFLTGGRMAWIFSILYCSMAFCGAMARVDIVWNAVDIGNAGMLIINTYGLLMLTPYIYTALANYRQAPIRKASFVEKELTTSN